MEYNKDPVPMLKNILSTPALLVCMNYLYKWTLEVTTNIKIKQTLRKILCKKTGTCNDMDMDSIL